MKPAAHPNRKCNKRQKRRHRIRETQNQNRRAARGRTGGGKKARGKTEAMRKQGKRKVEAR